MNKIIYIFTLLILFAVTQKNDCVNSVSAPKNEAEHYLDQAYLCNDLGDSSVLLEFEEQFNCLDWACSNDKYYFSSIVVGLKKLKNTQEKVGLILFEADASPPVCA